jgi:hypothetical protein
MIPLTQNVTWTLSLALMRCIKESKRSKIMISNYSLDNTKNIGSRADLVVAYTKVRFLNTQDSQRLFFKVEARRYISIEIRQPYRQRSTGIWAHQAKEDSCNQLCANSSARFPEGQNLTEYVSQMHCCSKGNFLSLFV